MGSSGYNQSQQNMMNIMGGSRPSELASKNTWQGVQGFPYQQSQQPDITNAGSIFGVNGMFGGAPTASQSFVSPGNVVSLAGGKGGINFGSLFGENNGGGSYAGENVGYGPPAGVGIDQYGYGPGNAGVGMVGPSANNPAVVAGLLGAFPGLAKGGIFGPATSIVGTALGQQPSAFDKAVYDIAAWFSDTPNFVNANAQFISQNLAEASIDPTIQPDVMSGWTYGGDTSGGSNFSGGLDPSGIPGMGGGAGGASPAK